jgi:hypothetical protein
MLGQCALCHCAGTLQNSHYMPKSVFRIVSNGHTPHDRAPVIMDVPDRSACRRNWQVRKHLLCPKCEGMFSQKGENVVIPQCSQGEERFALLDAMKAGTPTVVRNNRAVYNGPALPPGIDGSAYQYFAASMFWRGAVIEWPRPASLYFNALGPKYQEAMRAYLLGKAEFPPEARLWVFVDYQDKTRGLAYFPNKQRDEMLGRRIWRHSFLIPGIRFVMVIGGGFASFPEIGASSADRIALFEWHPTETEFEQGLFAHMGVVRPKGALADSLRRRPHSGGDA